MAVPVGAAPPARAAVGASTDVRPVAARSTSRTPRMPRCRDPFQDVAERRQPVTPGVRVVRAAVERSAVGRQEDAHGPATGPGQGLDGLHVDRVEVRALLAIHLDAHEVRIEVGGGARILEGFALHHVAPVAGGVADRKEDRTVLGTRPVQRLSTPGIPIHRVVRVLEQVWARLPCQAVHPHGGIVAPRNARGQNPMRRFTFGRTVIIMNGQPCLILHYTLTSLAISRCTMRPTNDATYREARHA